MGSRSDELKQKESREETVLVAMSGGVDSSVATVLLRERGYRVLGGMMRLWAEEGGPANRCCSPEAMLGARALCRDMGAPFYVFDYESEFKRAVVDHFVAEYGRGRTPNPCLSCNRHLKFGLLQEKATELGARYLATGHYARIRRVNSEYQLLQGVDPAKDQSYVLYMLGQAELERLLLPLGEYTKEQVREFARERGLPAADREESQEICFAMGDYRRFLSEQSSVLFESGPILDEEGRILGQHQGLPAYTVGQREGLGLSAAHPLYVLEIDTGRNALVVGPRERLGRSELRAGEVSFVSGRPPEGPVEVMAKIRYRAAASAATLTYLGQSKARVRFVEPQPAITPGQGVVFYCGEVVLGGGIIEEVG
jgi:tRNA-specific 2-thiouridylase